MKYCPTETGVGFSAEPETTSQTSFLIVTGKRSKAVSPTAVGVGTGLEQREFNLIPLFRDAFGAAPVYASNSHVASEPASMKHIVLV